MKPTFSTLALALLVCAAAPAATVSTTLTVTNATGSIGASGITVSGPATLTNGIGSGTFSATLPLTGDAGGNLNGTFTIALTGADKLSGTIRIPASAIASGTLTGSAAVTAGAGAYAGATGSFPSLSGTGSLGLTVSLSFTGAGTITTGGTVGPPVPTITAVLNAASNTAGIAQGAIFIVKGSNLSASGFTSFDVPRPTASNGVKITFTPTTGAATDVFLVYLYNQGGVNQLAAILPSTVAVGNYNVIVTNGTASAPFAAQVVASKVGLFTQDSSGGGLASVQNYISASVVDLNRLTTGSLSGTTISPAKPGQYMLAYGTGLGPLAAGDNNTSGANYDFSTHGVNVQAVVGGVSIPVAYAGRAGYPGEDQINFILPSNIQTGCFVSFQLSVNGVLSPATTLAIAPDASSIACVAPGFTAQQLKNFDNGATYTVGAFSLTQFSVSDPAFGTAKIDAVGGAFWQFTGFQLAGAAAQNQSTASDACYVTRTVTVANETATATGGASLDAGAVTLTGPGGSGLNNQAFTKTTTPDPRDPTKSIYAYAIVLGIEGLPIPGAVAATIVPGTYSVKGAGGKDVGAFTGSITLGPTLTVTGGLPSNVVRSSGLTLNWTGGNASDLVSITGSATITSGTGLNLTVDSTAFVCTTTAGKRTFTVPASILTQLPATVGNANGTGSGFLAVASTGNPTNGNGLFTAPLTAGGSIDTGVFLGFVGFGATSTYQ
jgi:uncharacterized protein (TIGR03437 family)